jgi:hypothetical protein
MQMLNIHCSMKNSGDVSIPASLCQDGYILSLEGSVQAFAIARLVAPHPLELAPLLKNSKCKMLNIQCSMKNSGAPGSTAG